jgi:hypothetical protein
MVVMVRNITRRKREKMRLREMEEKYREQAESDFRLIRLEELQRKLEEKSR